MGKYEIKGKITDLHDKIVSCELELERLDYDRSSHELFYVDLVNAYQDHITDLEEILKLL
jgi:hypothetical protein